MKIFRYIVVALAVALSASAAYAVPEPVAAERAEVAAQPTVKVVRGHVEINLPGEESKQVYVYALTGQLVKTVTAHPGVTVLDLPAGYYIVKCDGLSQRVIVR